MLFTLDFEGKKVPTIFVVADTLKDSYIKFKESEYFDKFKNLIQINDYCIELELIDIHKSKTPSLFGIRFKTKDENGILDDKEKMIIADDIIQIIDHFSEVNPSGVWRICSADDIVIA